MASHVQIITDLEGRPAFAVLPIADYDALVEAADEALGARVYERYRASAPETFPSSVADQLLSGANPVTVFRLHRGFTVAELADLAGVEESLIARLESGAPVGHPEALDRIARALGVSADDLTNHETDEGPTP